MFHLRPELNWFFLKYFLKGASLKAFHSNSISLLPEKVESDKFEKSNSTKYSIIHQVKLAQESF